MGAHSRPEITPSRDQGSLFETPETMSKEEGNARLAVIRKDVANRNRDYAIFHDRRLS